MYAVSDKFKQAIKNPNRKSFVHGTLTTVNGKKYALNDSNIIKDSLYITNQIVNDSKLCFGAVYAGECGLVINSDIDRYSLFGAEIKLFFTIELEDGESEEIPLGVFYVDTPERIGSKIKLIAVDSMSKFDVEVDEDVNGSFYEMVAYVAGKCGIELAQPQEEIEALHVNALNQYTIQQSRVETYREALSYLAIVICSNATIDRSGKLKFVQYATSPCDSNDRNSRFNNCKFSDYTTQYAGITARFMAEENYYSYKKMGEETGGIVLDCGDVPIVGGTSETKNELLSAMYDTLKEIVYTPATLYISSNPAYELGDMIECKNINNSSHAVNTYVMAFTYDYRKKQTLHCYGENPLLKNVKDKQERFRSEVESQLTSKEIVIVNATNASEVIIKQDAKDVVKLNFIGDTDCRPIVICTVPFNIDLDGYVEFYFCDGLVPIENAVYNGYYMAGKHFATFMYLDNLKKDERRSLCLMARCYADTNSAVRKQEARIKKLENGWSLIQGGSGNLTVEDVLPDTTEPKVTIKALDVKAIAYTQGINTAVASWDGTFEFIETVPRAITIDKTIKVRSLSDDVVNAVMNRNIKKSTVSDVIGLIPISRNMNVLGLSDSFTGLGIVITQHTVNFDLNDYTVKDNNGNIVLLEGVESQVLMSKNYDMSDSTILGIECAYVTASSDVVFAISVDDGVTWYMWTGEAWGTLTDTATGMTAETINAITTEQWAGLTTTGQFKVRMTLFDENSSFTSFVMDYIN